LLPCAVPHRREVAVVGLAAAELSITAERDVLTVTGRGLVSLADGASCADEIISTNLTREGPVAIKLQNRKYRRAQVIEHAA
jgi:hypothetical protein